MSVTIENPETGERRILEKVNGVYQMPRVPWRVVGSTQTLERQTEQKKAEVSFDKALNRLAALMLIPSGELLRVMGRALGLRCPYCNLRYEIWKKAKEIGWRQVVSLTWQTVRAQASQDEAAIDRITKEIEQC